MIEKGTLCKSLCCGRIYPAQVDFEPRTSYMRTPKMVYLRGRCFLCLLKYEIKPALEAAGIHVQGPEREL